MIDQSQAIEIARQRAATNGWAFTEPLDIIARVGWNGVLSQFKIETNAGKRGTKARFVICAESGNILDEGYIPR